MTPFNHCIRRTIGALDGSFGLDRDRRLVVTLLPGSDSREDLIEIRPEGTRRPVVIRVVCSALPNHIALLMPCRGGDVVPAPTWHLEPRP